MGLMDQAKADIKRISSDLNGFARSLSFVSKDGSQSATINGLHSNINLWMNTQGEAVTTSKVHISFSESLLNDMNYTTRDADNKCLLKDHLVTVVDGTGKAVKYVIDQVWPDDTVGFIVCLLGAYE